MRRDVSAYVWSGRSPTTETVERLRPERQLLLGSVGSGRAQAAAVADLVGYGPLTQLVATPGVTDVLVNGDGSVWVDRGEGLEPSGVECGDAAATRRLAVRLAAQAGRRLDDAQPWVDADLPGGVRLHAVLAPVARSGTHLSLRLAPDRRWTLAALRAAGCFGSTGEQILTQLVAAKASFLVSGGTGSGKTSLLAAALAAVPSDHRIVVVEDVHELRIEHPHVVSLQGRTPNVDGVGAVTLTDLVRQAMRMRPDRLVVGEARGAEVRELLAALNTGHEGGCATIHANTAADVPSRVAALGALAGMGPEAVATQLASAVRVVLHVARTPAGRRLTTVGLLEAGVVRPALELVGDDLAPTDRMAQLVDLLGGAAP